MAEGHSHNDNASFVEHLRLIHFTLLAGCFVALVAITSAAPSAAGLAYEELKQLLNFKQVWHDGQWLTKVLEQRAGPIVGSANSLGPSTTIYYTGGSSTRDGFDPPWRGVIFSTAEPQPPGGTRSRLIFATKSGDEFVAVRKVDEKLQTVDDAKRIWNALRGYTHLVLYKSAKDGWAFDQDGKVSELKFESEGHQTERGKLLHFFLRGDALKNLSADSHPWYKAAYPKIKNDNSRCYVAHWIWLYGMRADCDVQPLSLQEDIAAELRSPRPILNEFSRSFPNLDDLAKHMGGLTLDDLAIFINAERKRSAEKVELLGAKLPQDTVAIWGLGVLLAVSAYFWAIFRDFANRVTRDDGAWKVPWIGTSDSLSRVGFVVTLLFPYFTAGYLVWRGIEPIEAWSTRLLYVAALLAIGASTIGVLLAHVQAMRQRSDRI